MIFLDRCNKQDEKYGDVISEGSGKYGGFVLRNYKAQCICTFMFLLVGEKESILRETGCAGSLKSDFLAFRHSFVSNF